MCDDASTREDDRMTTPDRGMPRTAARALALAGLTGLGAVMLATPVSADPDPIIPGQPVVSAEGPVAPPAPPPGGPPMVPEIANQQYGSGQYGSGPLGTLRELWNLGRNPYIATDPAAAPAGAPPPPGAGPAPPLPPGFISRNAPGSETDSTAAPPNSGGPPLPPGYYPIDGPPPPGYEYVSPNAPAPEEAPPAG